MYEKPGENSQIHKNFNFPKFRGFMPEKLPIFLDFANSCLPLKKKYPLFAKMGTSMDVRFGREGGVGCSGVGGGFGCTGTFWCSQWRLIHYDDVIMSAIASQITSLTVVYSSVYWGADQRKHQSSALLAFVWGIHRDRWIPRTKGQLRGKCFHLMTSSCRQRDDLSVSVETPISTPLFHRNPMGRKILSFIHMILQLCHWSGPVFIIHSGPIHQPSRPPAKRPNGQDRVITGRQNGKVLSWRMTGTVPDMRALDVITAPGHIVTAYYEYHRRVLVLEW